MNKFFCYFCFSVISAFSKVLIILFVHENTFKKAEITEKQK
jgi:hypothetical protein